MKTVPELFNELYINGFAVMEDAIPSSTIDRIRASFMPMLEHVRDREHEPRADERGDIRIGCGRQQHPNRYTMQWPWEGGLACPEIVAPTTSVENTASVVPSTSPSTELMISALSPSSNR